MSTASSLQRSDFRGKGFDHRESVAALGKLLTDADAAVAGVENQRSTVWCLPALPLCSRGREI